MTSWGDAKEYLTNLETKTCRGPASANMPIDLTLETTTSI